jgi:Asp-tRNA(Asn)/Glu-tRNA(Gln) amidotransferase A subunit family amidase
MHDTAGRPPPGVVGALRQMRAGALTSTELTRMGIARVRALDARIEAWAHLDIERALREAVRCDAERASGSDLPLLGIPLGIKDVIATAGMPTRMGSPAYEHHIPAQSATLVARLESAGAFVFGKTVTTEFASLHAGKTHHPWNPAFSPGGSSSGSAAAVAAGFVPAAIGTQTRGSIIRPAAYCGVVGYKPSYGLIPVEGVFALSPTLDHAGVIARTVQDAGIVAAAMIAMDALKSGTAGLSNIATLPHPPRLAAVRTAAWRLADEHQARNFAEAIRRLREAGAQVAETELPAAFDPSMQALDTIVLREIADSHAHRLAGWGKQVSAGFAARVRRGQTVDRGDYDRALVARTDLIRAFRDFSAGYDGIVTPPATGEAPPGREFTGDASFCSLWTMLGAPAIVVPSGLGPNRLPLGLQIVGDVHADGHTLAVAAWCEQALGPLPAALSHPLPA